MLEAEVEIDSNGARIRAVRIAPDEGDHPGVVVVHDGRGFGAHTIGVARELADAGYVALAVDLYSRGAPAEEIANAELLAFMRSVPDEQIVADLQASVDFLAADPAVAGHPIGLVGYCWGGACAFLASAHCRGIAAAASWYGELKTEELGSRHPEHPLDALAGRRCPVVALFAELDEYVLQDHVAQLRNRRESEVEGKPELEIVVYPDLHHGFAHRGREHFDQTAHDDGWQRIHRLFDRMLKRAPA